MTGKSLWMRMAGRRNCIYIQQEKQFIALLSVYLILFATLIRIRGWRIDGWIDKIRWMGKKYV